MKGNAHAARRFPCVTMRIMGRYFATTRMEDDVIIISDFIRHAIYLHHPRCRPRDSAT